MKTFLRFLGFLWQLPAFIVIWLFYILPFWLIWKEIKLEGKPHPFVWEFSNPIDPTSWYDKKWARWGGWAGPSVMIIKDSMYEDAATYEVVRNHELQHCKDYLICGTFFYIVYILNTAWILFTNLFKPYEKRKHAYYYNWFELRARKAAGQRIEIPRNEWPDGPDDYNPWL